MSQGVPSTVEHGSTTSPSVTTSLDPRCLARISSSLQSSDLSFNQRHLQLFSYFIFEALREFNGARIEVTVENCVPMLSFSTSLACTPLPGSLEMPMRVRAGSWTGSSRP